MTSLHDSRKSDTDRQVPSLRKGFWYFFDDGDIEIAVHGSSFGLETIYMNGEVVSKKRSFGVNSRHNFRFEGSEYEILFLTVSMARAAMECIVLKGNRLIGRQNLAYFADGSGPVFKSALYALLTGMVVSLLALDIGDVFYNIGYIVGSAFKSIFGGGS